MVFRESAESVEPVENREMEGLVEEAEAGLSRKLLSAVETYKAACAAAGEEPTQEDAWVVLLSALQLEDAK